MPELDGGGKKLSGESKTDGDHRLPEYGEVGEPGDAKWLTRAEVEQRLTSMTPGEHRALRRYANNLAPYGEGKDLIQEVISRSLSQRRWRRDMATVPFLVGIMNSITYTRRKTGSLRTVPLDSVSESSSAGYSATADHVTPERNAIAAEEIKNLEAHFADDVNVWCYLQGIAEGRSAKEVQESTGMTAQQYDAARKKVSRYRPSRSEGK